MSSKWSEEDARRSMERINAERESYGSSRTRQPTGVVSPEEQKRRAKERRKAERKDRKAMSPKERLKERVKKAIDKKKSKDSLREKRKLYREKGLKPMKLKPKPKMKDVRY